jgi:hypothetical protein
MRAVLPVVGSIAGINGMIAEEAKAMPEKLERDNPPVLHVILRCRNNHSVAHRQVVAG